MKIRIHVSGWAASGFTVANRTSGIWSGWLGRSKTWAIGMPRVVTSRPAADSWVWRSSAARWLRESSLE
jgi:hypothetical protein